MDCVSAINAMTQDPDEIGRTLDVVDPSPPKGIAGQMALTRSLPDRLTLSKSQSLPPCLSHSAAPGMCPYPVTGFLVTPLRWPIPLVDSASRDKTGLVQEGRNSKWLR